MNDGESGASPNYGSVRQGILLRVYDIRKRFPIFFGKIVNIITTYCTILINYNYIL